MRTTRTLTRRDHLAVLAAGLLGAAWRPALALEAGQALPVAAVPGPGNAPVRLVDGAARATYIDFWASWCGPCRQSFPWMNRMQEKFGAKGLRVLAINLDAQPADARRFLDEVPARFELAFDTDGRAARQFGIRTMPSSILVDGDGKVLAVHQGFRREDEAALEERIARALGRP